MDHRSLDSMTWCRIGLAEARGPGIHRSHDVEGVQEDIPAEGLQPYGNLWGPAPVDNHNTYRGEEDSFGKNRLPCTGDSLVAEGNLWRVGFYQSRGRRCGDLRGACFLRG